MVWAFLVLSCKVRENLRVSEDTSSLCQCQKRARFEQSLTVLHLNEFRGMFGEGNGTPLQYSFLENPTDGGAWWAAVRGIARSRTRLSVAHVPRPSTTGIKDRRQTSTISLDHPNILTIVTF